MLIDLSDEEMMAVELAAAESNPANLMSQTLVALADKVKKYRQYSNVGHYKKLSGLEQFSSHSLGVQVWVAIDRELTNEDSPYQEVDKIVDRLMRNTAMADPEMIEEHARLRTECESLFSGRPILIEEIPNKYWSDWFGVHRPWFVVTTTIGRFEVGWRKRVMSIDWSGTIVKTTAETLFPDEDVTKEGRLIHAWSVEKAREYISKVLQQPAG